MNDRISQQPDEILVQILSLLSLKEAGRSSVLSRRWKDLWKWTTSLAFDLLRGSRHRTCLPHERSKLVTWVNQVLRLHESPWLNKCSLVLSLDGGFRDYIDQWIQLIIQKRVKILEICLFWKTSQDSLHYYYGFSQECLRAFKSASNLDSIKCLMSLSLRYVMVDGELIQYLVCNCPHLEKLYIAHSHHPSKLKIAGMSVQLKYLEIILCRFESIELSAPKLVSFRWSGFKLPDFHIGSNPLLSDLNIRAPYSDDVTSSLVLFSSDLPQLDTLSLRLKFRESCQVMPQIPVLRNLKQLVLGIWIYESASLIKFSKLIVAAPFLVKFSLQLNYSDHVAGMGMGMGMETELISQPHQCLEEVEILGFLGNNCDFELAMFLAKNAVRLEKMIIGYSLQRSKRPRWEWGNTLEQVNVQVIVLKKILSPGAKLILKESF